jgi:hypothetical protein
MNNYSRFIAFLVLAVLVFSCNSHKPLTVKHVRQLEVGHQMQGFYYALPRTVVSIDITVIKTDEIPGPFAQFAGKYLGIDNVITRKSTRYQIAEVEVNTFAEPDPAEFYFVEYNPKNQSKNPFSISLSESGMITSVNRPVSDPDFYENMVSKTGFGYYGSEATFNHFIEMNLQEKIDTIVERVRMDTITIERQTLRRSWVEKSSEVRAKEVADYILRLRNKKFDIISGFAEINYSRDALKFMHDKMEEQETAYLELFTGISAQSKIKYRFTIIPSKEIADREQVLFHFSETEGVLTESRSGSEPIYAEIKRHNTTRQLGVFLPGTSPSRNQDHGFYYRIPEYGQVSIRRRNSMIAEARLLISQFGLISNLPAENLKIEFYPATGALKIVEKIER